MVYIYFTFAQDFMCLKYKTNLKYMLHPSSGGGGGLQDFSVTPGSGSLSLCKSLSEPECLSLSLTIS